MNNELWSKEDRHTHNKLEAEANKLLEPWLYDRSQNPEGDILTDRQITNKQSREKPSSHWYEDYSDENRPPDDGIEYVQMDGTMTAYDGYFVRDEPEPETFEAVMTRLKLTPTQQQVATILAEHLIDTHEGVVPDITQKEIATQLGISQQAVSKIINQIRWKLSKTVVNRLYLA